MPRGEGNGLRRVPMMDGSDHSRRALARRGLEMGGQGPRGRLEFCPIHVQLNWKWFSSRTAPMGGEGLGSCSDKGTAKLADIEKSAIWPPRPERPRRRRRLEQNVTVLRRFYNGFYTYKTVT